MGKQLDKLRKIMRIFALTIFAFLAFILVMASVLCVILRFDFAENYIRDAVIRYTDKVLSPYHLSIQIDKIELALPFSFDVCGVSLNDSTGAFTKIEKVVFRSDFLSLLRYQIVVPEIGLINAQIKKVPHILFPLPLDETKKEMFSLPKIDLILTELANDLFHPKMPTIRLSKISVDNMLVDSSVMNQIESLYDKKIIQNTQKDSTQKKLIQENFDQLEMLRIDFIADVSLDDSLLHIGSLLEVNEGTGLPLSLNTSLDIFKFGKIRSRIQYNDSDGVAFRLAKDFFSLPHSQNAYASFHLEGTGRFDEFSMEYNADIFDDMYMNEPGTLKGRLGIVPLFATMDAHFFPKISDSINHGDVRFNTAMHLFSEANQAEKAENLSKQDSEVLSKQVSNNIHTQDQSHVKNIQIKYDFSATSMSFANNMINNLLGDEQKSKGQLNIVFSTNDYPYATSDNIYFGSKNIKAHSNLFISRNINMSAQASILDLSALGSKTRQMSGRADGKISLVGDANKLFLDARFEVPILTVKIDGEEKKKTNDAKKNLNDTETVKKENINKKDTKTKRKARQKKNAESQTETKNDVNEEIDISDKNDTVTKDNIIELKSFVFVLKSDGKSKQTQQKNGITEKTKQVENIKEIEKIEKNKNAEKNKKAEKNKNKESISKNNTLVISEKDTQHTDKNEYNEKNILMNDQYKFALQVRNFYKLFSDNKRKPLPFSLDIQAKYNDNPVHFSSKILVGTGLLGENSVSSRDLEINDILFQGLGAQMQGNMHTSWRGSNNYFADFDSKPLLRGNLDGSIKDGKTLAFTFDLPMYIDDASFKWSFSVGKPKKSLNPLFSSGVSLGSQKMHWQFSAANLIYETYMFENNSMDFIIEDMWVNPLIKISSQIKKLEFDSIKSENWQLKAEGSLLDLDVETSMNGDASFLFKGIVGIDRKRKDLFLDMDTLNFTYPKIGADIRLKQKGQLRLSDKEFIANKIHFLVAPKGEIQLNGVLRSEHVALNGWWKDINLKYLPFGYEGYLLGRFNFQGTSKNPTGTLDIRVKDLRTQGYPPISLDIKGSILAGNPIHKLALILSIVDNELMGAKDAEIAVNVSMESEPRLRISRTRPIEGILKYDGALAALWKYMPFDGRKLIGHLFVDGRVSGTVLKPFISLNAQVKNASYQDIILGILLNDIDVQFDLNTQGQGKVQFFALDSESGTISLQGDMVFPWLSYGAYQAPVKIAGEIPTRSELKQIKMWEKSIAVVDFSSTIKDFKPLQRSDLQLALTGDLKITGMITDPSIIGSIRVDEGTLHLENIQGSTIPKLNIVEKAQDKFKRKRNTVGNLDFSVDIVDNFYVFGPGLESEWKGNINISGKLNQPSLSGSISAIHGEMNLLERDFTLVRGEVSFDGSTPISPAIDVQLGYKAKDIDAKISVSGTADSPELDLTSVPYLPEDEILSRILFFSSVSNLSPYEKIRLAAMLTSLTGFSLQHGIKNIGHKFLGLDVIRIGNGASSSSTNSDDEEISVELGKYVKDKIYLGIEQGISNQETMGITNFEINKNFSVGAQAGTEDAEVNFEWKFDY